MSDQDTTAGLSVAGSPLWRRQLLFFAATVCCLGFISGITETTFSNFLVDVFHISALNRSILEFPREAPGFLVAIFAGALFFLAEVRMAALAAFITAIGLGMLGSLGSNSYPMMIIAMIIWSSGGHLFMPIQDTISLRLAGGQNTGTMLGRIGGYANAATIVGCLVVWIGRSYLHFSYPVTFAIAAVSACVAGVAALQMRPFAAPKRRRPKFVFRRRYSLYYLLCILFGARKQVFLTFGPFVLITIFKQPPETIAKLWIVALILGMLFKPALGWMIDRLGERFVLMTDALLIIGVCLGYGMSQRILPAPYALWLVYTCFVADMLLFAMEMARSTYMDKIALKREDVGPTLTLGVSINHLISMSIPILGGKLWDSISYTWVFVAAAGIAVITFFASSFIRVPAGKPTHLEEAQAELAEETV